MPLLIWAIERGNNNTVFPSGNESRVVHTKGLSSLIARLIRIDYKT
jgi:hypothetical protein